MFYPEDIKESVLKQILTTSKTVAAISRGNNIPIEQWWHGKLTLKKERQWIKNFLLKKSLI